jgi:hypothetical protein
MEKNVYGIECFFGHCSELEKPPGFNRALISLIQDHGARYCRIRIAPFFVETENQPAKALDVNGNFAFSVPFIHPLLEPNRLEWVNEGEFFGKLGGGGLEKSFYISCFLPMRDDFPGFESALQSRAESWIKFFQLLAPIVKPQLGYIDDTWGSVVKDKQMDAADLKNLFWVTYFGPTYIERHGKDFFLNAPAWKIEELDEGILLRTTETFLEFTKREPQELIKYLRQRFKNIKPNRFNIHPAF